jgi:cytochrome c553
MASLGLNGCGSSGSSGKTATSTAAGSSSSPVASTPEARGMNVFVSSPKARNNFGSAYACANCHALEEPNLESFVRAGHPIGDALRRPSFKNGQLSSFLDAANSCLDEWMGSPTWTADSQDYQDLVAFLDDFDTGSGEAPEISYDIVEPIDTTNLAGDPLAGQLAFNQTCAACHGEDGEGGLVFAIAGRRDAQNIANKVRLSGFDDSPIYDGLIGGTMPFWSADRLDDSELTDIIAFILTTEVVSSSSSSSSTGSTSGCSSTHPKIGQSAQLSTKAHGVSGTATIIDDCTVRITNFNFDGQGVNVRIYSGINGNYGNGFAFSGNNLVRSNRYVNETLEVTVPEGFSLDSFNGVSVWCVPFTVSFGDGIFN